MKTISTEELKKKMDAGEEFQLVDVLSKEHYETQHLPNAINIPVKELAERVGELDKSKEVIVYCASKQCEASPTAARKLEELGFNVADYEEGVAGWKEAGHPLEE